MTAKQQLRRRVLDARHHAVPEATADALAAAVLPLVADGSTLASYVSVGGEPSTKALHRALADRPDVRVVLPLLLPDGELDWAVHDGRTVPAARGLLQPSTPPLGTSAVGGAALVVVPALAVDRHGHRLGRGGGSYDRALRRTQGLVVALLYDDEAVDEVPFEPHDVRVGGFATPSGGLVLLD